MRLFIQKSICTSIRIFIIILFFEDLLLYYINIVDYYLNTVYEMQNEKDFFYHYNVFEYIQDFEIVFQKSDNVLLVFVILDNNVGCFRFTQSLCFVIEL